MLLDMMNIIIFLYEESRMLEIYVIIIEFILDFNK